MCISGMLSPSILVLTSIILLPIALLPLLTCSTMLILLALAVVMVRIVMIATCCFIIIMSPATATANVSRLLGIRFHEGTAAYASFLR